MPQGSWHWRRYAGGRRPCSCSRPRMRPLLFVGNGGHWDSASRWSVAHQLLCLHLPPPSPQPRCPHVNSLWPGAHLRGPLGLIQAPRVPDEPEQELCATASYPAPWDLQHSHMYVCPNQPQPLCPRASSLSLGGPDPFLEGCRVWDLFMSTSHIPRKLGLVPHWANTTRVP